MLNSIILAFERIIVDNNIDYDAPFASYFPVYSMYFFFIDENIFYFTS